MDGKNHVSSTRVLALFVYDDEVSILYTFSIHLGSIH